MTWWKRNGGRATEATEARKRAERALEVTRERTPVYRQLAKELRELREENHYATAIRHSFRGEST